MRHRLVQQLVHELDSKILGQTWIQDLQRVPESRLVTEGSKSSVDVRPERLVLAQFVESTPRTVVRHLMRAASASRVPVVWRTGMAQDDAVDLSSE